MSRIRNIMVMVAIIVFAAAGAEAAEPVNAVLTLDNESANSGNARVRVGHLSPDAPAVDIWVNDAKAIENLAFEAFTGYVELPAATYNIKVVPSGATEPVVIEADLSLAASTDYTVIATDLLANISPVVLIDDNSGPVEGNAWVRFVHASPDAPAVDLAVSGGPVLFSNISFQQFGTYLPVPAGTYDLEVRIAGTNTAVLYLPGISLADGDVYTAFASGLAADGFADRTMYLMDDRFRIEVQWTDFRNNSGIGFQNQLTSKTGYFTFFNPDNVELVVKVLDGTPLNGNYWVFFGALSNVEYSMTVTDTMTGKTKTYNNASGTFASVGDTQAFGSAD